MATHKREDTARRQVGEVSPPTMGDRLKAGQVVLSHRMWVRFLLSQRSASSVVEHPVEGRDIVVRFHGGSPR